MLHGLTGERDGTSRPPGALRRSGRWQRAPDDERVDAALILAGILGALPSGDPRTLATLRAVTEQLTEDGYCYRFRPDARPLGEAKGAFLLCGFRMALACAGQGDEVAGFARVELIVGGRVDGEQARVSSRPERAP